MVTLHDTDLPEEVPWRETKIVCEIKELSYVTARAMSAGVVAGSRRPALGQGRTKENMIITCKFFSELDDVNKGEFLGMCEAGRPEASLGNTARVRKDMRRYFYSRTMVNERNRSSAGVMKPKNVRKVKRRYDRK